MMDNTITISRCEYELLIRAKSKNELVRAAVMADSNKYGLGDDTKYALELILGINNIEKADCGGHTSIG